MKSNIILTGMPGAGKSTIGAILSKTMNKPFIDTDLLIQKKDGRKLQDIINNDGRAAFTEIEEKVIAEINEVNHIIATGGSVVYSQKAMGHLKSIGVVVYLDVRLFHIRHRLKNIKTRGVLLKQGQTLHSLYKERHPLYKKYADIIIDCSFKHVDTITNEVREKAQALLAGNVHH